MIKVNEKEIPFEENLSLFKIKQLYKSNADIIIYNGFPVLDDLSLSDGDEIVLIKRGEIPDQNSLETLMAARHTPGVHLKVKQAKVGIAGLGGLGSSIAIALARLGVGNLVLVDFDVVEPSNLNRQQYFVQQIGIAKTDAIKEILNQINPYINIITHKEFINSDNVHTLFEDVDILVEAFDKPEFKSMLINTFLEKYPERYMVSASGLAGYDDADKIKTKKLGHLFLIGDGVSAAEPGRGLMAPRVGVASHLQANKVLEIILGVES